MFKRIEKKQKKREREEELGLDDETKQMYGLNDTDSDESSSSSSASSSSESGSESGSSSGSSSSDDDNLDKGPASDMKTEWLAAEDADSGSEDEDDSDEEGGIDLNDVAFNKPNLTIKEAVKNPIYLSCPDKDWHACLVCPKKMLKCAKQVELHLASAGHVRRFQKFTALAETKKYMRKKDPTLLVTAISQDQRYVANAQGLTKRSRRRQIKLEKLKKKRELKKQIIERKKRKRAKKEAPDGKKNDNDAGRESASQHDKSTSERPQKKRKVSNKEVSNEKGGVGDVGAGEQNMPTQIGKTNAKSKGKTKERRKGEGAKVDAAGSQSEPKSKTETAPQPSVEASKSVVAISGDAAGPVKRRDEQRIKTKGHMGKAGAGRFAKLSDTRAVKDKSTRKARPERKETDRTSFSSRNPSRYYDAPEDPKGPKEIGPTEIPLKKSKRPKKGNEDEQTGKAGSKRRRSSVTEDLAIFD